MQAVRAVLIAAVFAVAAPALADAQAQVQAARKAERRGDWHKALDAWKAAYAAEGNAEYLIGIGDAYAHLGEPGEAKKNYEAYLADPLAMPANIARVKAKLAQANAALASAPLPLPGVEPAPKKVATATPLELPLPAPKAQPASPAPGATAAPAPKKDTEPAVASKMESTAKPIVATAAPRAPAGAVLEASLPRPHAEATSGTQRTMAYVTAVVAVAALGGGTYAFMQANSAHSDLTGKVHDSATAQQLLETERRNKTLSFVGFSGGLVAAGISAALFAF
jgi:tetratricopeptide (TPR) repeat protein